PARARLLGRPDLAARRAQRILRAHDRDHRDRERPGGRQQRVDGGPRAHPGDRHPALLGLREGQDLRPDRGRGDVGGDDRRSPGCIGGRRGLHSVGRAGAQRRHSARDSDPGDPRGGRGPLVPRRPGRQFVAIAGDRAPRHRGLSGEHGMTLLAKYNLKSLMRRKAATISTALSFALAVAVFVVLMGLAKGVLDGHHRAGNERNIVVLQKGASDAHFGSLSSEDLHKIRYREFVARTPDGRESESPELELVSWVTLPQVAGKRHTNLRGVTAPAVDLHGIQLEQGRLFRGSGEGSLGKTAAKRFGLGPGDEFTAEDQTYKVTGIFSCSGSVIESEVWCDLDGLMAVSGRMATTGKHSSMVIRVGDGYDPRRVCDELSADK